MPLLDGAMKSAPYQIGVSAGDVLGVTANGVALDAYQELLTSEYGFVQFGDAAGGITLARPVAIAQTAGGVPDQEAVVRIRQNGGDQTQLEIYRVDDLNGGIDTGAGVVLPGQAGYAAAAAARNYQLVGGGTVIDAPGQKNFLQVEIADVDQGDIVALKYTNVTTGEIYWAFSQGNTGQASAIFAYGLNTWGSRTGRSRAITTTRISSSSSTSQARREAGCWSPSAPCGPLTTDGRGVGMETAQLAAQDLARRGERQFGDELDLARVLVCGETRLHEAREVRLEGFGRGDLGAQLHEGLHDLGAQPVGTPTTPTIATAGCFIRHSSISPGPMR